MERGKRCKRLLKCTIYVFKSHHRLWHKIWERLTWQWSTSNTINMFFPSLHKGIIATTVAWLFHFHIQSTTHLLCFFLFILFRSSFVFIFCLLSMALCLTFFFHCSFTFSPIHFCLYSLSLFQLQLSRIYTKLPALVFPAFLRLILYPTSSLPICPVSL